MSALASPGSAPVLSAGVPPAVFIVLFVLLAIGAGYLAWLQDKRRRESLAAWADRTGLGFDPSRHPEIERRYALFSCFRQGSDRYAKHLMEGERHGRRVAAFDYHYVTTSTDSKGNRQTHHHNFSAVVVETDLPLRTLFIRPEGFFDKITEAIGFDDIDFELAEFSRSFYVKAPDRRWAFDVLHQATMEFLLAQPRFTVEMGGPWVLVRRASRFKPEDFEGALGVAEGILDRLPRYLVQDLKGGTQ